MKKQEYDGNNLVLPCSRHDPKWWRGEDSNLRRHCRQIYSLFPLATREPLHENHKATLWQPINQSLYQAIASFASVELAMGLEPATC